MIPTSSQLLESALMLLLLSELHSTLLVLRRRASQRCALVRPNRRRRSRPQRLTIHRP
jgi:hypothetical protein